MKLKKILVPTDFSKTAEKARNYGAKMATEFGAELLLLNAWHIPYGAARGGAMVDLDQLSEDNSQEMLDEQEKMLKEQFPNLNCSTISIGALAVDAIQSVCNDDEVDLVVMGTTGASGITDKLLGSTTSRVIGKIKVPLITVPHGAQEGLPEKIYVAVDLSQSGDDQSFGPLKVISRQLNASIDFITIVDEDIPKKEVKLIAADFDEEFDPQYHPFHYRENDDAEEGILKFLEGKEVDLLTVIAQQRGFWEKLLYKSVSKAIVKHASFPVLVLPD